METRKLGRTGTKVSSLCLGAMTFGDGTAWMAGATCESDADARLIFDRALDAGITFIDTANVYNGGRSEELLGEWMLGRRDALVLATKCRMPMGPGPNDRGASRRAIILACEASLRRLRTDRVDLYQIHMQDPETPIEETLRALDDLQSAGKIVYAGCSNYTGFRLAESLWAADRLGVSPFVTVQALYNLVDRDLEREIVPACQAHGLGVLPWSPLASGFLSGKYRRGEQPAPGTRLSSWKDMMASKDNDRAWGSLDAARAVAAKHETTPSRVALAWLLRQPTVSSVIIGARTMDQLEDNLGAAALSLDDGDMEALDAASRPQLGYPYDFIRRFGVAL